MSSESPVRKIIHIDMDAFFASVEQRDKPELRGRPVAVGGSRQRGVVAAASYEAREFGVRSAMPSVTAARRCPDLIFVAPRFDVYREVSLEIRQIFYRYSDLVEPLSLDEAYLDVTADIMALGSALQTAHRIRGDIYRQTELTASAGVSYNKFLAKIASDQNKPDGVCLIHPRDGETFVASLPVRRFHGVGPRTAERMARLGIKTGADLRLHDMDFLQSHFGKFAGYLFGAARGVDNRKVKHDRVRKSVGRERTFAEDLIEEQALRAALDAIVDSVWERIKENGAQGRTLTLKVKYANFRQITRSQSFPACIESKVALRDAAHALLQQILPLDQGVRLLGVSLSGLQQQGAPVDGAGRQQMDRASQIAEQVAFEF
ncbi:MAG: DNA polymerase IV [Pseudomonadota bacterium]